MNTSSQGCGPGLKRWHKKKQLEYRRMLNGSALRNGLQMMQLFDDLKVLSFSRKYTLLINLGKILKKPSS